jgi:hypothetical protein
MPDVIERLAALHVPTTPEGRCQACTTPGRGTPAASWPCSLATLAAEARRYPEAPPNPLAAGSGLLGARHAGLQRDRQGVDPGQQDIHAGLQRLDTVAEVGEVRRPCLQ